MRDNAPYHDGFHNKALSKLLKFLIILFITEVQTISVKKPFLLKFKPLFVGVFVPDVVSDLGKQGTELVGGNVFFEVVILCEFCLDVRPPHYKDESF